MVQKAIHVWVSGRVQGVGYRYYTSLKADELGIKGWVRNLTDGRVEAWFEGTQEQLQVMTEWCYQGSPMAAVTNVEQHFEQIKAIKDFRILR